MANTYTQLFAHYILTVKFRRKAIDEEIRNEIEKYICGIAKKYNQKVFAVYCMPEHTHILISRKPDISDAKLMQLIKCNSSKFINEKLRPSKLFRWQEGYGAFSVSPRDVDRNVRYILGQREHHQKEILEDEYKRMLKEHNIEFEAKYLFDGFLGG